MSDKWYRILILNLENVYSLNVGSRNQNLITCTFSDYLDRIVCTHTQSRVTYISQRTPVDSRWLPKCRKIDVILPSLCIVSCFLYTQDDTFLYNRNWRLRSNVPFTMDIIQGIILFGDLPSVFMSFKLHLIVLNIYGDNHIVIFIIIAVDLHCHFIALFVSVVLCI